MDDDQKQRKRGCLGVGRSTGVALLLIVLLSLYILSIGPATTLLGVTGSDPFWFRVFQWVYGPLAFVPPPFEGAIERWVALWDFYGVLT